MNLPGDTAAEDPAGGPRVTAVIVAYGAEPLLVESVRSALASDGVSADVVLVDNGCTDGAVDRLEGCPGVRVLRPGRNLGFAEGCCVGVEASAAPLVALVNPDAVCDPAALGALAAVAAQLDVGLATASVRLADRPELLNSAGNEVHFLGLSWSGAFEEPASSHATPRDVCAASGAGMAFRREVWDRLGGFDGEFFAYYEDADLSLRCWLAGLSVRYVPGAVITHRYSFSKSTEKYFLLERNRWVSTLSVASARRLLVSLPGMVAQELALSLMARRQGWTAEHRRARRWILSHRRWIAARRRRVQATRTRTDAELADLFAVRLAPANMEVPALLERVQPLLDLYWRIIRVLL